MLNILMYDMLSIIFDGRYVSCAKDQLVNWLSENPETQSFIELNALFCEAVESSQ